MTCYNVNRSDFMRYNVIKDANKIINKSPYLVSNPENYKNKWNTLFENNKPIHLELGTGRGEFIINMAKAYPNINFIGLELYDSQLVKATDRLRGQNLPNLKLILYKIIFYIIVYRLFSYIFSLFIRYTNSYLR